MRILAMAGSTRKDSYNRKLLALVVSAIQKAGAEVTVADLSELAMPFYNGDLEQEAGLPVNATKLKGLLRQHDLLLIACPEYNGFFPALLKNTLDWMSRAIEGEKPSEAFKGKAAAIVSASPGGYGGQRAAVHLRTFLSNLGMVVQEETLAVPSAHQIFDGGASPDATLLEQIENFGKSLAAGA